MLTVNNTEICTCKNGAIFRDDYERWVVRINDTLGTLLGERINQGRWMHAMAAD